MDADEELARASRDIQAHIDAARSGFAITTAAVTFVFLGGVQIFFSSLDFFGLGARAGPDKAIAFNGFEPFLDPPQDGAWVPAGMLVLFLVALLSAIAFVLASMSQIARGLIPQGADQDAEGLVLPPNYAALSQQAQQESNALIEENAGLAKLSARDKKRLAANLKARREKALLKTYYSNLEARKLEELTDIYARQSRAMHYMRLSLTALAGAIVVLILYGYIVVGPSVPASFWWIATVIGFTFLVWVGCARMTAR